VKLRPQGALLATSICETAAPSPAARRRNPLLPNDLAISRRFLVVVVFSELIKEKQQQQP
jgi:hypothetical protein